MRLNYKVNCVKYEQVTNLQEVFLKINKKYCDVNSKELLTVFYL